MMSTYGSDSLGSSMTRLWRSTRLQLLSKESHTYPGVNLRFPSGIEPPRAVRRMLTTGNFTGRRQKLRAVPVKRCTIQQRAEYLHSIGEMLPPAYKSGNAPDGIDGKAESRNKFDSSSSSFIADRPTRITNGINCDGGSERITRRKGRASLPASLKGRADEEEVLNNGIGSRGILESSGLVRTQSARYSTTSRNTEPVTPKAKHSGRSRSGSVCTASSLCSAVENQHLEQVCSILTRTDLDLQSFSPEGLSSLDIALLTNNMPITRLLMKYRVKPSDKLWNCRDRVAMLDELVKNSKPKPKDRKSHRSKDSDRSLSNRAHRHELLKRMRQGFDHISVPGAPRNVILEVASRNSLILHWAAADEQHGDIAVKYLIQWSKSESFTELCGQQEVDNDSSYVIPDLESGERYYVRIAGMNLQGRGPFQNSDLSSAAPSCWKDAANPTVLPDTRHTTQLDRLQEQLQEIMVAWKSSSGSSQKDSPTGSRKTVKKSLKNLFASSPKFQKATKRGVYLASIVLHDNKVMVTTEDQLPMVEVDDTYPGTSLTSDFHWLLKLCSMWTDTRSLRDEMERITAGATHFKTRLLQSVCSMQTATGLQNLGQFYYRPIRQSSGCVILVTMTTVSDSKLPSSAVKWTSLHKLVKRTNEDKGPRSDVEELVYSIDEIHQYCTHCTEPLPPGLYLGFMKLHSSVDRLKIVTPASMPNVLPHTKIRTNSFVSREEWQWIQDASSAPSDEQIRFRSQINEASRALLQKMGVPQDQWVSYRILDQQLLEHSPHVTFMILMPSSDEVCTAPGTVLHTPRHGRAEKKAGSSQCIELPLQAFELNQLQTYKGRDWQVCSSLSLQVDVHCMLLQQLQREAFSGEELSSARTQLTRVQALQSQLEEYCSNMRWVSRVVSWGRDKSHEGLQLSHLTKPLITDEGKRHKNSVRKIENSQHTCVSDVRCKDSSTRSRKRELSNGKVMDESSLSSITKIEVDHTAAKPVQPTVETADFKSNNTTSTDSSIDSNDLRTLQMDDENGIPESAVLRVYAAYNTGLTPGTSVRLHVTRSTSAQQIITIVVQQLYSAALARGLIPPELPTSTNSQSNAFCLVTVVGQREKVIHRNFFPLRLREPWSGGCLFVRRCDDILAALEHSPATAV